ncbi:MAG: 2,3-bisphosphoglycerate-independent phosphoglycerate mutase, partial [bacterium]|nr:2,3-bisphosphoglycerate-independent phosphoglycerate mutase [bacterium]
MKNNEKKGYRPTVLIILDGWGVAIPSQANGITQAKTPFFDSLVTTYPTVTLQASGEATGLPWGEVGNSEVGHMSIGAGRIVYQELSRITQAISNKTFFSNEVLLEAIGRAQKPGKALHLIGMASSGGVHSHIEHLSALLELSAKQGVSRIYIHAILDGRDTPYASGLHFIQSLQEKAKNTGAAIASISGRFYAMDRDNHWDREEKAYRAMAEGLSEKIADDPVQALEQSYADKIYDEEFPPTVITSKGKPIAKIQEGDAVIFFNIRADRARQLTRLFVDSTFNKFKRTPIANLYFVTLTEYEKNLPVHVAFP